MLILASASPRREELLRLITTDFRVEAALGEEQTAPGEDPARAVARLALSKAREVAAKNPGEVVIGADTVVAMGDEIFGKPADSAGAARMLRALSGRRHRVCTGVAVVGPWGEEALLSQAEVWFGELAEEEIARYVATGEPLDKAGAYGIQGRGALLVERVEGDYYAVVGLPVFALGRCLARRGALEPPSGEVQRGCL